MVKFNKILYSLGSLWNFLNRNLRNFLLVCICVNMIQKVCLCVTKSSGQITALLPCNSQTCQLHHPPHLMF